MTTKKSPTKKKAAAKERATAKKKTAAKTAVKKKATARRQSLAHTPGRLRPVGETGPHPIRTIPPRRQVQSVRERLPSPQEVREGIDTDTLDWLRDWLHVSDTDLNEMLRISRSTLDEACCAIARRRDSASSLDTAIGAQRVIRLLSRLEYGIPT